MGGVVEEFREKFLDLARRGMDSLPEARSWSKVYQFVVDGEEFYVVISNGEVTVEEGRHPSPIATLTLSRDTLAKILSGELDAMKAFLSRELTITGNVFDTMNLKRLIDAGLGSQRA